MSISKTVLLFFASILVFGCSEKKESSPPPGIRTSFALSDRTITLDKFLTAYPYDTWRRTGSLKHGSFFTLKSDAAGVRFVKLALPKRGETVEIGKAAVVPKADLCNSLTFDWDIRKSDGALFLAMDQNNDERFNIYQLNDRTGELTALTDVPYVSASRLSPDEKNLAYLARVDSNEESRVKLHVKNLTTGEDRVIATDDETNNFTWSELAWSPDASQIAVTTIVKLDRNKKNLALVKVDGEPTQRPRLITETKERPGMDVVRDWLSDNELLYYSDEEGSKELYSIDVMSGQSKKLTDIKTDVEIARKTTVGRQAQFVFVTASPRGGKVYRWKPESAPEIVFSSPELLSLLDVEKDEVLIGASGHQGPMAIFRISLRAPETNPKPCVVLDRELEEQLVHCSSEEVRYKTFDDLTYRVNGDEIKGEIMATLYSPKKPAAPGKIKGLVRSFYGGETDFDMEAQLLCMMGHYVLSPAVRGDYAISSEFERMNDGDTGGKETLDAVFGAKFLAAKSGLSESQIGTFGHSHGGYSAQRLVTFSGKLGDVEAQFGWGFAISAAGFSDLEENYNTTNVKGTVVKEAGDPSQPGVRERWKERSPVFAIDRLKARLLLIHGDADKRVPYQLSKTMFDKVGEKGKAGQVTLATIEGMGHVPVSLEDKLKYYGAWIDFLQKD